LCQQIQLIQIRDKKWSPDIFDQAESAKRAYEDFLHYNRGLEPILMGIQLDVLNTKVGYEPATLPSPGKWYLVGEPREHDTITSKISEILKAEGAKLIKETEHVAGQRGGGLDTALGPISDILKFYNDAQAQKLDSENLLER
jgi:hypothetical protein